MMGRGYSALGAMLVLSAAAHLAFVLLFASGARRPESSPTEALDFELVRLQAVVKDADSVTAPASVTVPASDSASDSASASASDTDTASDAASDSASDTDTASDAAVVVVPDISPRTAALSMLGHLSTSCQFAPGAPSCAVDSEPPPSAEERLQSSLEAAAALVPHLGRRKPPKLRRKLDGRHEYEGHVFTATIAPDGTVAFEDRLSSFAGPLTLSFDLTDMVEKHILDKQLYSAERLWFLNETAALREELSLAHRGEMLEQARLRLRGRLIRILRDRALSPTDQHMTIFALWDDCAGDEVGLQGQRIIEGFVQEQMPRGSELAFSELELAQLNAGRVGGRAFSPYGTPG